jgi:hypothetical protein
MAVNINGTGSITGLSSISSPGISGVPVGSASAPAFSFTGDTNTGIYSPGADQVAVATNGTGRLFVDASGNIKVSTGEIFQTSADGYIRLDGGTGSGSGANVLVFGESHGAAPGRVALTAVGTGAILAGTGGAERLRITSGGLVGIGTSTPVATNHIRGSGTSGQVTASWILENASSGAVGMDVTGAAGSSIWRFLYTGAGPQTGTNTFNTALSIGVEGAAAGRVGIGTTSPTKSLEVAAGGTSSNGILVTGSSSPQIRIEEASGVTGSFGLDSAGSYFGTITNHPQIFRTNSTERARIDSSGRLLVGTSSARATWAFSTDGSLQVERSNYAAMQVVGNANTTSGAYLSFLKSRGGAIGGTTIVQNNDELGWISFEGMDGANPKAGAAIVAFVDGTPGANDMPGRLVFSTTADGASTPTERMRIGRNGFTKCAGNSTLHDASGLYHEFISNTDVSGPIIFCRQRAGAGSQRGIDVYYDAVLNSANNAFFTGQDSGATRIQLYSNGGIANFSANDVNLSDRNVKKDISPTGGTWECLKEWEIVRFRYKDQPDNAEFNIGVIAQQIAESCPEVVTVFQEAREVTGDLPAQEERIGVKEQQMYWMAIKALQEAQARIETLEQRLNDAGIN